MVANVNDSFRRRGATLDELLLLLSLLAILSGMTVSVSTRARDRIAAHAARDAVASAAGTSGLRRLIA
jgi:Tfp pilus assembly protein FimT